MTLDELEVESHFPKEGVVLSRKSRSLEKFMHGIKVLMAKNYIDNLSEEARKGMQEKAEQGIWPTVAPLGYRNVAGPDGKKIIEPDPETAPIIARLFEWYATGSLSLREAAKKVRAAGLVHRKSGAPVPMSTVHSILRNRLYSGEFEWNGRRYAEKHQPLISLVETVLAHAEKKAAGAVANGFSQIWLPFPSWTRIEPCALCRSQSSGASLMTSGRCGWPCSAGSQPRRSQT